MTNSVTLIKAKIISSLILTLLVLFSFSLNSYSQNSKIRQLKLSEPPVVYKIRGDHYRRLGLLSKALNEYDKALTIKSNYSECHYWKATIYEKKQLISQALLELTLAMQNKNNFPSKAMYYDTLFLKAELYSKMEESENIKHADKLFERIITELKREKNLQGIDFKPFLKHRLGKGFFLKGKLAYNNQMSEKDITWFEQAINNNYKPDLAYYYQYLFYKKNKNKVRADKALQEALKHNPNIMMDFKRYEKE